ncbi:hypothetical protein BMR02_14725 [Methylococcaceae bacterium HT1]|nr:hypothetical protein BMR02_14725 [Methylococcaceae bacterium HT1]TXL13188.1 hypothetical protein BMR04_14580 [Methylococcaceae bacterium HT3]TXL16508.1 hypothetical protein BMR06_15720 [Methylococcaceae bacterium HT5]
MSEVASKDHLEKGNREVITDYYVPENVEDEQDSLKFKVFVRLNAKKITFRNVCFLHCIFDNCYLNNCVFDSCNFTGCKFIGSNFHKTSFIGCKYDFATFERCQIDDDILISEAPIEENLKRNFARSLRINYQQVGNAKAANGAIKIELEATLEYLYKSWSSKQSYYKKKYPGFLNSSTQFLKWIEFWVLDFIWGNGESILKFVRTIGITLGIISIYDTASGGNPSDLHEYWINLLSAPLVFLGVSCPENFSIVALSVITGIKLIFISLLTALLVKRFSKR